MLADRFGDVLGKAPVLDDRLADVGMPVAHDLRQRGRVLEQAAVTVGARQDVDLADVVQQAREHRLVGVDAGSASAIA